MSPEATIYSIDQNCHPLWDVPAKLCALSAERQPPLHLVEDIDVAFTAMGASDDDPLRLERERFYASGGQDWGAAVFYSEFLGTLPLELRDLQPYLPHKLAAVARKLGTSLEELYDEYSPGDNWQLIGPSYAGGTDFHRVLGDLRVAEAAPFLRELLDIARRDLHRCFPSPSAVQRSDEWLAAAMHTLETLLQDRSDGVLSDLYGDWLTRLTGHPGRIGRTSRRFTLEAAAEDELLKLFLTDYDTLASLYNQALKDADSPLRPLHRKDGELPFFATLRQGDHLVRTGMHLRDGRLCVAGHDWPLGPDATLPVDAMGEAGVLCIAGKAVLLVLQVRLDGSALALPYHGSLYTPATHALQRRLEDARLLPREPGPILRVRLHLLDRLAELETTIRLPSYLARAAGRDELHAKQLAAEYQALRQEAAQRLDRMTTRDGRSGWQREAMPAIHQQMDTLDARRRELAQSDPKGEPIRDISHRIRELEADVLARTLGQVVQDTHVRQVDYWDSRGAIEPWCVALGGERFYQDVVARAEILPETAGRDEETQ